MTEGKAKYEPEYQQKLLSLKGLVQVVIKEVEDLVDTLFEQLCNVSNINTLRKEEFAVRVKTLLDLHLEVAITCS